MFTKVLIANRGEIAVRIARTCRELGIATVAVYSDVDRDACHVRAADEAVHIGPASAAASYLSIAKIVDAARRSAADAVHPGYGFLAESPALASACADADLAFVGPPAAAMRLMGDKTTARRVAIENEVPVLPGADEASGDGAGLLGRAREIGFPLMVKAAVGGGGRGMRRVETADALPEALAAAGREAQAAFGDARIFLERALVGGRHIEVQILADCRGNSLHLGERDCSIQRRHQKVIEESPAPAVTPAIREQMHAAALRIARAAGYVNAGTVEFLVDREGRFFFLEMNTRLQVEHGVTELVVGRDLVADQLRIAAGEPLGFSQSDVQIRGHAIECRIYAEDPSQGFLPSPGRLGRFAPPGGDGIRNDAGVESGSLVPAEYDPLLAKLLVHGATRDIALERCRKALAAYVVEGVRSNLDLLEAVIALPDFQSGRADLSTVESIRPGELAPCVPDDVLLAAAVADLLPGSAQAGADPWMALGAWRLGGVSDLTYVYRGRSKCVSVARLIGRRAAWRLRIDDRVHEVEALLAASGEIVVLEDGARQTWSVLRDATHLSLAAADGRRYTMAYPLRSLRDVAHSALTAASNVLRAPMHGEVIAVLVREGDQVRAGQPLVILEAMKMEHTIAATAEGVVIAVRCAAGQKVAEAELLLELEIGGE